MTDALLLCLSVLVAYALRFEGLDWPAPHAEIAPVYLAATLPLRLLLFYGFGLYRRLWYHASVDEIERVLVATLASALLGIVVALLLPLTGLTPQRVPLSVVGLDALFAGAVVALPRLAARLAGWRNRRRNRRTGRRVLVVGAGEAGQMTVKELFANPQLGLDPIGFVDDDRAKHRHWVCGLPVFGPLSMIKEVVAGYHAHTVIIAMPAASGAVVREVVKAALEAGAETRTVPGLYDILSGKVGVTAIRQVEIQDLLRREPIQTDFQAVVAMCRGQTVLVTGAGGSIGSELCRQVARTSPSRLVLLGHGENSIFEILHELRESFPALELAPVIADVRDAQRIAAVFRQYRPAVVFHAAAHKHVPLMEENVVEAVTNNVLGTRNVVDAAAMAGTERFVLISTDKAVRPTSVMGATKRVAEQIVQLAGLYHARSFVSVRFGNVLGSRGSVVPTFLRQIRQGGPVRVTHAEMRRFFMTIPEAVQLVLQAGAIGDGGEVFVLDMGEPVRIVDLATDLIRLSGLEVGTDIQIEFTGVRPGEKLYEEMFFSAEFVQPTDHPKVLRARKAALRAQAPALIEELVEAAERGDPDVRLRELLVALVPDFQDQPAVPAGAAPATGNGQHANGRPPAIRDAYRNGNGRENGRDGRENGHAVVGEPIESAL